MINSNGKPKVLQNEPWLKDMWNDISISGIDLDWKIYQKNIDNYVIEKYLSINLYTIFDYDEYLFNDMWYVNSWKDYKNKQPYNQNLRNLKNFKNEHGNNKSLFEYIDKINFLKSEEMIFCNRYIDNDQFIKYFNNLEVYKIVKSDIGPENIVKLHFTLKKLYILMYKHITKFPIDYKYGIKSIFYKNGNIYLHFNDKKFKKIPFKEFKTEEKQRQWIEKLFWENEDISKHEELLLNVINFEQVSFDGITKVKKENEGYNIMIDVLKCENKEKYFMDLYLKLMLVETSKTPFDTWIKNFYGFDISMFDFHTNGDSTIKSIEEKKQNFNICVQMGRKYKSWNTPDYSYIEIDNDNHEFLYSEVYFERWDKKNEIPLYILLNKNLNEIFLEESLGRYITKFVSYKHIIIHWNKQINSDLKELLSSKKHLFEDENNDEYTLLKRIYTFEELNEIKKENEEFLGITDLKILTIKLKNNRKENYKYIELTIN